MVRIGAAVCIISGTLAMAVPSFAQQPPLDY